MSSSRRSGGEIHILAMLDGKTTGSLSRRLLGLPRACWYAAAAVIVCVLLAVLAWLVRMPAANPAADNDDATTPVPTPAPMPSPILQNAPASRAGAAIIDVTSAPVASAQTTLVAPRPTAAPVLAPPSPLSAASSATVTTRAPAPAHATSTMAPPTAPVDAAAPRIRTPDQGSKHHTAHAAVRTTNSERKPASQHAAATRTEPATRAKRQTGAAKPTPSTALDTDVALISAIIQHTSTHPDPADTAPDTPQPCTRPGCHTRLPNRQ